MVPAANGKKFTVRVSPTVVTTRTDVSDRTVALSFYLTVEGSKNQFKTNGREDLGKSHTLVFEFLNWFFENEIYARPARRGSKTRAKSGSP